jgi:hypothetical protein
LGPPSSDLGVYVWNLWVFRHEILAHQSFPFFTLEILSLTPRLPLTLQNYTTLSDLIAFFFIPVAGLVATFNLLTIANVAASAYAMFLLALRRTRDIAAAFSAGILFGFSPFMTARSVEHLSLTQAAPLPIFLLVLLRMKERPTLRLSGIAGLVVAWAFLSDPYYAVYCLLMLAGMAAYSLVTIEYRGEFFRRGWWTTVLDVALLSLLALIVGVAMGGGGRLEVAGHRLSVVSLYTPVLVFITLLTVRVWTTLHLRLRWALPSLRSTALLAPGAVVLAVTLAPTLYPILASTSSAFPGAAPVVWRNSAPGLDLASYFLPSPFNPLWGTSTLSWFSKQPNGLTENVASLPVIALVCYAAATLAHRRWASLGWLTFTMTFALLSLGPFIVVGGTMTYVPGPWAFLRYLPIVGAARMPTRLAVLAILGASMLLALAIHALRTRSGWPRFATMTIPLLLIGELVPTPRPLFTATLPSFYQLVASDPRPVRVMNLPFGLRDGLSSAGNQSAEYQYHQTSHEKPIVGGYVSRLPLGEVERYRRFPVMSALMDASEGRTLTPERRAATIAAGHEREGRLRIGWVVVDQRRASPALESLAIEAFDLTLIATEGHWKLYKNALDQPSTP